MAPSPRDAVFGREYASLSVVRRLRHPEQVSYELRCAVEIYSAVFPAICLRFLTLAEIRPSPQNLLDTSFIAS